MYQKMIEPRHAMLAWPSESRYAVHVIQCKSTGYSALVDRWRRINDKQTRNVK